MTILTLAVILTMAFGFAWLADRVGLPTVVGQIGAGMVLGPAGFHYLASTHSIGSWAEIGLLILMFLAGIESDFDLLKRHARQAVVVAIAGVVTPFVVFLVFGWLLGESNQQALLWAVLFSATSVSITAQLLAEYGQVKSTAGATILGAAVLDDLLAILMWTIYQTVFRIGSGGNRPLWLTVAFMVIFLVVFAIIVLKYLGRVVTYIGRVPLPGAKLAFILAVLLASADLAEWVGFSGAIVAFLLGLFFSQESNANQVEHSFITVGQTIFIPVFFVNIGLKVSLANQWANLPLILMLTILAIGTKWFGAYAGARWSRIDHHSAQIIGAGMVSRGEMAIVIADLALSVKTINSHTYALLTIVILLTTIFTPIALKRLLND
ncbi:cation:proton antiporter [Fructobacillus ficulneus]|uniref:Na+/H+ antiporter n=1 Tax=Fructobacillus ficulneus TaxID=157463 RepID=A0A0K8MJY4_9LACO|nr:cation:proton antiporter [Fructobacillus ficulneus]GAP00469.1 Na+/H+ antiporter [Fructobacillus ficulneus]